MLQNYGKWDKMLFVDRKLPILVWQDVPLFDWSDKTYLVGVSGDKGDFVYYCSVFIINAEGEDCLASEHSQIKDSLPPLFLHGTARINPEANRLENLLKTLPKSNKAQTQPKNATK